MKIKFASLFSKVIITKGEIILGNRKIRIGIDVGGTFTHAVAVDHITFEVIAHAVTPTTHFSRYSVSEGIIKAFHDIMQQTKAVSQDVVFVSHSTTQATNALLEGDVAKVGIIGMGKGIEGVKAKSDTLISNLELSKGKMLHTAHCYFNTDAKRFDDNVIKDALSKMMLEGCNVIVASEAFGVDDSTNENKVLQLAAEQNLPATASHEISQLYGLKIRTRTAVINASILPKMTHTAELTEESIKKSGITSPLMIMRSDGGVMDIVQMKKRPILTMLSGPAAGIAAALMFAKVSDGIFLEVGGTSTDISAIKNGKAMIKSASVGGHKTYLKTLDSRTVGIGGGSMVRISHNEVADVGPRSAHIAGLGYIAFTKPEDLQEIHPVLVKPMPSDPDDYLVIENNKGERFAITLTDASMMAGMTTKGDYAYGNFENVKHVFEVLAQHYNTSPLRLSQDILDKAIQKVGKVVQELLEEYHLDMELVSLVGGGGGATCVVPWLSQKMNIKYFVAEKAEVISAIGAAMAMLRDCMERTVLNPTEQDIMSIRKQVTNNLIQMGANSETIEVQIEIDQQKNILRATAVGSIYMDNQNFDMQAADEQILYNNAALSMKAPADQVIQAAATSGLFVFAYMETQKKVFGLFRSKRWNLRVIDRFGVIKLQVNNGRYLSTACENISSAFNRFIDDVSVHNDVGMIIPEIFMLYGSRIVDFSTILDSVQLLSLIQIELQGLEDNEPIVLVARPR
ncbi:hydantoinase/oxoprolinase family protein [Alkaliphilus peptidifermentans]|uniref:N-methylhydantoinase A/oxoprolinase/acetone carboxylase, beta subunit n=1 Tax=Alkaliphilus peptidifermentans DSM 18978 TaxID=1120976 RepID=A0A1G5AAM2_9FIRM|nr:hydantoinase/oxoprolinase family protein [Alkaliphilus peptidifermentans]SCX74901.1 N-methylhydantoinase A/oxoprolinase/acetone carboxylase, beta subunit [Alkaliphilus peptidifermentans DSM 18978]